MFFSASYSENSAQKSSNSDLYSLRRKFHCLFHHGWDFIVKSTLESTWKTIKKYKLTEQKCWYKYTDPKQIIGLRFGTETTYGLYDIDWGSQYDPREQELSLSALKAELELYGIVSEILLQSSDSGGLHLYFFLDRPINTFKLACVMNKAAVEAGLEIERGQLETFPNTKRYDSLFNGHRLPLQQGSYLLDRDYVPYSDRLEHLIDAASWSAERNDTDLLESRFDEAYDWFLAQKNQSRVYSPTSEDKEFIEQVEYAQREIKEGFLSQIRIAVEQGFTGTGETNELLLTIAKLGRILHGLSGQRYIDYITETVTSCPGYAQYCRHKHEINRRCREVARYGEQHWYPYRSSLPQNRSTYKHIKNSLTNKTNLNHERQHNAKSRIIQAVDIIIQQQGKLPSKVGECKLAIRNVTKQLFGISVSDRTLNKRSNLPLWHPKHRLSPTTEPTPPISSQVDDSPQATTPEIEPNNTNSPTSVIQPTLQPKQSNSSKHSKRATPLHVARPQPQLSESTKATPSQQFKISCHTLPYMKGMSTVLTFNLCIQIWHSALLAAYSQKLIKQKNQNLVFLFSGYRGKSSSSPVQPDSGLATTKATTKLKSIKPDSYVTIQRNLLHSSYFRDDPKQILVYVRSVADDDDCPGAIAVPIEQLSPIRYKNQISHSSTNATDSFNSTG